MSMTVKDLIEKLKKMDENAVVVMAKDSEGNGYSPLAGTYSVGYRAEKPWYGEVVDEFSEGMKGVVPAVLLTPTN